MISQPEIAILRSLKKTAIVMLLIFRLDKPVGRDEIAQLLDIDPRTVSNYLNSLMRFGLITRTHYQNGYILSQYGRQMILGQTTQDLAHLPVALKDLPEALPSQIQALPEALKAHEPAQALPTDDELDQRGTICAPITQFVLKEVKEEVVNNLNITSLTTLTSLTDKIPFSMLKILAATPILFGEPGVLANGLPECQSGTVLGWLAHAYQQRHHLKSPAGLVYSQLKKGNLPGTNYLEHPELYLPFDFMQAIGYSQAADAIDDCDGTIGADPDDERVGDPSLEIPINGHFTINQAWKIIMDQLSNEMPKPTFDTWLGSTRPMHWSGNCLTIGAPNAFACDWLASRLTSKIIRLLSGILNQTVLVIFEVRG